ncbi:MAG: deoxyribodipyrimidine photo-lyase, partial [Theionarchaea archaeon]|nr:deoxyribodipyrimidine photo-lyase [Theionarchaea archaeon]
MSRDQRVRDNWALVYAQRMSTGKRQPVLVLFCLVDEFLGAQKMHFEFMIEGLRSVCRELLRRDMGFRLVGGDPAVKVPEIISELDASILITDFSPLRIKRKWIQQISMRVDIPFFEVDAHNIVPCWTASQKAEYGAYTIRPKLRRLLGDYLVEIPRIRRHPHPWEEDLDWEGFEGSNAPLWIVPGENEALGAARGFIASGLRKYHGERNDPSLDGQSNLSPYLHFGQLSAQRLALEVLNSEAPGISREAFLEELIVRRELSDNFCYYNEDYDSTRGFPDWARRTLEEHRTDRREYTYSLEEFEGARTHDELWNAAQLEMVRRGKMHGYMRMYWAKKLLEWSETPEMALETGIYLNDRYELDGRDPNGYAGMAWS